MTADEVAQRLVESGLIRPEHAKTLADALTDFAADQALRWERHEWALGDNGIRFGPDDLLLTYDRRNALRLVAAHTATARRLSIVQSQLDQIRDLTEYDA